jgi:hypothetical protein
MSFQKQSKAPRKTQVDSPDKRCLVSLIGLAANLDDPNYRRALGKLSIICEELQSINATHTKKPLSGRSVGRCIE